MDLHLLVGLGGLRFPAAQRVASRLAHRVTHVGRPAQHALDRFFAEARQQMTGTPTGIALDEEERRPLDDERSAAEPTHRSAEEPLEAASGHHAREREA